MVSAKATNFPKNSTWRSLSRDIATAAESFNVPYSRRDRSHNASPQHAKNAAIVPKIMSGFRKSCRG
jgi:hypothetical protein